MKFWKYITSLFKKEWVWTGKVTHIDGGIFFGHMQEKDDSELVEMIFKIDEVDKDDLECLVVDALFTFKIIYKKDKVISELKFKKLTNFSKEETFKAQKEAEKFIKEINNAS